MKKTAAVLEIKSTRIDVLVVALKTTEIELIDAALHQRFDKMLDTSSVPLLLDLSCFVEPSDIDLEKILSTFKHYGLNVIGLRHPSKIFEPLANENKISFNLIAQTESNFDFTSVTPQVEIFDSLTINQSAQSQQEIVSEPENEANNRIDGNKNLEITETESTENKEIEVEPKRKKQAQTISPEELKITKNPTLIIKKPVRTGQQIYAKNADLIILDLVSPGAEVLADGNIHIYGPLRGRALAGISGDRQARIFTQSMQAELVSIAGVYRTIEQSLPQDIANKPAQICIEQDKLVIKHLK